MPILTIVTGSLLSIIGVLGYALGDSKSLTALIPLLFGSLLEACGVMALKPALKKHAMHGASVIALLGVLGASRGVAKFVELGGTARPLSVTMQLAMFVICLVFLALCIRSFMQARAGRLADAGRS
jgi:succinate-acetate transporter protein